MADDEDYLQEEEEEDDDEEEDSKPAASSSAAAAEMLSSRHSTMTKTFVPSTATTTTGTSDDVDPNDKVSARKRRRSSVTTSAPQKYLRSLKPDELFVDFYGDSQIVSSRWGQDRLDRYISIPELDSLVGWAAHTTSSSLSPASLLSQNPLLGLATSNTPLQPSLLKHLIQDPATRRLQAIDERNDEWAATYGLVAQYKMRSATRSKGPLWECLHHSAAVALGMLAEEMLTALLLPLARLHIQRCRRRQDEAAQRCTEAESRNATAAAPATPSAADLERNHSLQQEWTLPPEEAVLQLAIDGTSRNYGDASSNHHIPIPVVTCLATALPPTRTTIAGALGTSLLNQPHSTDREQQAVSAWYRRHSRNLPPHDRYYQPTIRSSTATVVTHPTQGHCDDIIRLLIPQLP